VIDFWGLGYEIAERMGLASEINRIGYHMRELRIVDSRGERVTGFGTSVFRELTGGRFVTLGRSDLSRLLFAKIEGTTDVLFGDEIVGLEEDAETVRAQFKHAGRSQRERQQPACQWSDFSDQRAQKNPGIWSLQSVKACASQGIRMTKL
jgi:2-polyprenyl-6-methoxyphenol hydroxylase-like FAD-dependent oxidoreductase